MSLCQREKGPGRHLGSRSVEELDSCIDGNREAVASYTCMSGLFLGRVYRILEREHLVRGLLKAVELQRHFVHAFLCVAILFASQ